LFVIFILFILLNKKDAENLFYILSPIIKIENLNNDQDIIIGIKRKSFGGFKISNSSKTIIVPKICSSKIESEIYFIIYYIKIIRDC
jgi:hypothetical protein